MLYHDCGGSYMTVYILQNASLKTGEFYCTAWYLHSAVWPLLCSKHSANTNLVPGIIASGFVHVRLVFLMIQYP